MLGFILLFTFLASILSLFFVGILLLYQRLIGKLSFYLVSFAAGALLAAGFTDTLTEAVAKSSSAFIYTVVFIAFFYVIERVFLSLHHHEAEGEKHLRLPLSFLLFGDALHNFIDGISIAATFLISFELGIITSIAVFIHEIPHELGDFGILLHLGYKKGKVLGFNILTGLTAFAGAILGYLLGNSIDGALPVLLALTSGNFIYLSLSDLLPEIHEKTKGKEAIYHTAFFILGISFIIILGGIFKG